MRGDTEGAVRLLERCINRPATHALHPAALRLHCRSVSRAAQVIAEALAASGADVNADEAAVMGLIHDVGRSVAGDFRHRIEGYRLAREAGFPPDVACACITHMTMGRATDASIAEGLLTHAEAQALAEDDVILEVMSLEEQIVGMVDSRVLNGRFVSLDVRIGDLEARKGPLPAAAWTNLHRIADLAASFERVLGCPLARFFPEGDLGLQGV